MCVYMYAGLQYAVHLLLQLPGGGFVTVTVWEAPESDAALSYEELVRNGTLAALMTAAVRAVCVCVCACNVWMVCFCTLPHGC